MNNLPTRLELEVEEELDLHVELLQREYIQRGMSPEEAQDRMEAIEGIRRGLESMKRNAGKPAEKFFREFFAEKGISERE